MKCSFIFLFTFISVLSYAQSDSLILKKNEIKTDFLSNIFLGKFSITYERILNDDFSVGLTGIKTYSNLLELDYYEKIDKKKLNVQIIPYFRYNLKKYDANSFLYTEAFLAFNSGKYREVKRLSDGQYAYYKIVDDTFFDVAPGLSFGYKQYILKNVIVDLNIGLGINLFDENSQQVVPRVGFNIGYRF